MNELVERLQQIYVLLDDGDRHALSAIGLTPTQYTLLRSLDQSTDGELTVSRLADVMLCTRGNATRNVRRLNDAGLVATRGTPRDQRLVVVTMTAEGRRRLTAARNRLDAANQRRFHDMNAKDLAALRTLATRLAETLARDLDQLG